MEEIEFVDFPKGYPHKHRTKVQLHKQRRVREQKVNAELQNHTFRIVGMFQAQDKSVKCDLCGLRMRFYGKFRRDDGVEFNVSPGCISRKDFEVLSIDEDQNMLKEQVEHEAANTTNRERLVSAVYKKLKFRIREDKNRIKVKKEAGLKITTDDILDLLT